MRKSIQHSLILALSALAPASAWAGTLNADEAKQIAAEFFQSGDDSRLGSVDALTLAYTATDGLSTPVSYVFNARDGKGFVIVSADTDALPVIGYSTTSVWETDAMPGAAGDMISTPLAPMSGEARRIFRANAVAEQDSKLLNTPSWSQEAPFNFNIPNRRLTGCVGVALAEILKYHGYPTMRPASLVKEGEATSYDWANMRGDNYRSGYTDEEAAAVATLVADAAIGIGTDFGMSSSSAFEVKVPYALTSLFGYDAGVSYKKRAELSKADWDEVIVGEIDADRPVLYSGQDVSSGHAFVCDGYEIRGGVPYFHINWGWGGSANGYYASDALNPVVSKAHHYNDLMTIVYNIKPAADNTVWSDIHVTSDERQTGLTLNVDDIAAAGSFTVRVGALKNISNTDFKGKLAVALYDAAGNQKGLLNDGRNFSLISMQISKYVDFSCKVPAGVTVADGDVVRLCTMVDGAGEWRPVAGDLLAPGQALAKGYNLPYFQITLPGESADYTVTADDARVIKGRDYKFSVAPMSADKVITVRANGFILTPAAGNAYTLTNVLEDQRVDVIVQNAADVLTKATLWVTAGNLQNLLTDEQCASVKELTLFGSINANDFAFMRDRMKLTRLDISQTSIAALGSNPANAIPTKAFMGYRSLQQILLPGNLTTFKNGCLAQTGLRSIDIPASVGTWEYNVFVGCNQLREVIARRSAPAWVNWCVFSGVPQNKLIVPVGSAAAYAAKDYWKDFKEIEEGVPAAPPTFSVTVAEKKGLKYTFITEGTEFNRGDKYEFRVETDDSYADAVVQVFSNATQLYPDANGVYTASINGNTLIHVECKEPLGVTPDTTWKLSGDAGGIGLVTSVVNVPFNQNFVVRANAIKIPYGNDAAKFYAMVLTDAKGGIKEFISSIVSNYYSQDPKTITYNFNCKVKEATIQPGNRLRLATSYDKKNWQLVEGEDESITYSLPAIGNPVILHKVTMPTSVTGARIEGASAEVVRGMPFTVKASAISGGQRVTIAVNGETKANKVPNATVTIPAVLDDLDITISVADADAGDYMVFNIQEGKLAEILADCPDRVKLIGNMLVSDFDALRKNAGTIIDLDMADVTIKGAAMTGNQLPENAFTPSSASTLSALKTVILPNNLERINKYAFARCTQLTELTIPAGVNYVGDGAFASCVSLKKIIAKPKVAPACGNTNPFPSGAVGITLEVPKGSEDSYSVGSSWWSLLSLNKPAANAKDIYWIKRDASKVGIYMYNGVLERVEVGQDEVVKMIVLPNNQSPGQFGCEEVMRPGVPFKVYDNGIDVFANLAAYSQGSATPNQSWSMTGGRINLRWIPSETSGIWAPKDHEITLDFYYELNFEYQTGANGVTAEIVEQPEGCEWRNVTMYMYNWAGGVQATKPVVYKEGSVFKFQLANTDPRTEYIVRAVSKVITKPGRTPVYEERDSVLTANGGIYTVPALEGDTRILISGVRAYAEGEPIPAEALASVKEENAAFFTELTVTGEMDETNFETIRENFGSVETLDLSQLSNEVIPEGAFAGMESLTSVIVPETVTEIGAGAFADCDGIETITLPGVNSIGEGAFEGCDNLTSILIPSSDGTPGPSGAPRKIAARNGGGITAESFRGLNPNCLIYIGENNIPDSDHLNIILNRDGHRVAASEIILDGNYSFNAPASFGLGDNRISLTIEVPGSIGNDELGGWKGFMLPFTPTSMEYGVEFADRKGSGLHLVSFDGEEAETMTPQEKVVANRPYLANVAAPFEKVPVTFYATTASTADEFVYDVPFTPVPEETVAVGKDFSLYGSFDGETTLGTVYTLNETADTFLLPSEEAAHAVGAFGAYLRANHGVETAELAIGEHALWICEPQAADVTGTELYRSQKVEMTSPTKNASIYYTVDGSDPTLEEGTRTLYEAPFALEGDAMDIKAVALYKDWSSDVADLKFQLKKTGLDYDLAKNWNWISHNVENAVAVSDFADAAITRIVGQNDEAVRDPQFGLIGTLSALEPAVGYKVLVGADAWKGKVSGVAYDPTAPVALAKGWNWIGTPADGVSLYVADLFSALEAEEGDMIVGLEGFAQVDADGRWMGSLDRLVPGAGYMFFSSSAKEFTYALVSEPTQYPTVAEVASAVAAPWVADIHAYPSVMPMTAVIADSDEDYAVGAFCGDECRGTGVNAGGVIMLNIHGNVGDVITFRFLDMQGRELRSDYSVKFGDAPLGTLANPYRLTVSDSSAVETIGAGEGYVVIADGGGISVEGDLSAVLSVAVYDAAGNKLAETLKGNGSLKLTDLEPGVRLVVVRTAEGSYYTKVLVK